MLPGWSSGANHWWAPAAVDSGLGVVLARRWYLVRNGHGERAQRLDWEAATACGAGQRGTTKQECRKRPKSYPKIDL